MPDASPFLWNPPQFTAGDMVSFKDENVTVIDGSTSYADGIAYHTYHLRTPSGRRYVRESELTLVRTPEPDDAQPRERLTLLQALQLPNRMVCRTDKPGRWYVTQDGGEFDGSAVRALRKEGVIRQVYSWCPKDLFHIGETRDLADLERAALGLGE